MCPERTQGFCQNLNVATFLRPRLVRLKVHPCSQGVDNFIHLRASWLIPFRLQTRLEAPMKRSDTVRLIEHAAEPELG